jgi:uroporphyrin-III C-methyltransferase
VDGRHKAGHDDSEADVGKPGTMPTAGRFVSCQQMTSATLGQKLEALRAGFPVLQPGHVWLVGAGPGDPGLLTLAALAALDAADVVVHDALIDPRVLSLARPGALIERAGKRGGAPSVPQDEISRRLIALARSGRRVVRLKGGDPFVFARGGEEALALAEAGVPFRILSGVTAGLAGLVAASIPATLRGVNQAIILATGHAASGPDGLDWAALAKTGQPLVIYMAMHRIAAIAAALVAGGLAESTPAAVIAAATLPEERILISTLRDVAAAAARAKLEAPAILAVGAIVAARGALAEAVARLKAEEVA